MGRVLGASSAMIVSLIVFPLMPAETEETEADIASFISNGVRIAYLDQGHGEPVVLLQGFCGRLDDWRTMHDALLEAGYRVIAMDSRGHGESGKPHNAKLYGPEMADDIRRLLDHLKLRRAHVIGYSMGGDIANKARERHPSRLITVTLGGIGRGATSGWTTSDFNVLELARSLECGDGLKPLFREPGGAGRKIPPESEIEKMNARIMEGQDPLALAAVIRAYAGLEVSEESLENNSVPALAIVGEHDVERPSVDELKRVMKNLQVVIIQDADHFSAGVQPEFTQAVLAFLRTHRDR
jgi:pimeloyl-ACP methyl ester carboxylesterase